MKQLKSVSINKLDGQQTEKNNAMNSWIRKGWISLKPYSRDRLGIEKDRTIGRSERIGK